MDDPELAIKHLIRLHLRATPTPDPAVENQYSEHDLLELIAAFDPSDTAGFEENVLSQANYANIAQVIILLWYSAAFIEQGFAVDSSTADDNQYTQGLIWRAIQAHPMPYAPEGRDQTSGPDNFHYWRKAPEEDGKYSGLGMKQPLP